MAEESIRLPIFWALIVLITPYYLLWSSAGLEIVLHILSPTVLDKPYTAAGITFGAFHQVSYPQRRRGGRKSRGLGRQAAAAAAGSSMTFIQPSCRLSKCL